MIKGKGPGGGGRRRPPVTNRPRPSPTPRAQPTPRTEPETTPRSFHLGAIPGATPGKWIDTWKQRMPHVAFELVPIATAQQREALAELDAALVRLPIDAPDDLHVIPLYEETTVVVASVDSHLLAVDELDPADLEAEVLVVTDEDALHGLDVPAAPAAFGSLPTMADAIATVATGVGIVIVPMSLARLHHRKDIEYRPLRGAPTSTVALAWRRDHTTADVETFVGIVRGRSASSSR